jgi:signal transduction histidine kinase
VKQQIGVDRPPPGERHEVKMKGWIDRIGSANRTRGIVFVFVVMIAIFQFQNVIKLVQRVRAGRDLADAIGVPLMIYTAALVAFIVLLFRQDTRRTRVALVATLIAYSVVATLFDTPREIGGDLVMVFAAVLAQKYGFLRRRAPLKITGMALLVIIIRVITVAIGVNELYRGINQMAIAAASFPLAYWLFETDLQRIQRRAESLDSLVQQNAPFVEFGRNVTGVVHDLRNDVSVFRSFGTIIRDLDEEGRVSALERYDHYVERLERRVERIMYVTRPREDSEIEETNLAEVIEAVVFVFRVSSEFKGVVDIRTGPLPQVLVVVPVQPLMRLLENVIRNSCEAIARGGAGAPGIPPGTVQISIGETDGAARISIVDNGPGFPFDWDGNTLDAPRMHDGFTERPDGSGYGLRTVRNSATLLDARVVITSKSQIGVTTIIEIPWPNND